MQSNFINSEIHEWMQTDPTSWSIGCFWLGSPWIKCTTFFILNHSQSHSVHFVFFLQQMSLLSSMTIRSKHLSSQNNMSTINKWGDNGSVDRAVICKPQCWWFDSWFPRLNCPWTRHWSTNPWCLKKLPVKKRINRVSVIKRMLLMQLRSAWQWVSKHSDILTETKRELHVHWSDNSGW